jgi:hypothetical protein
MVNLDLFGLMNVNFIVIPEYTAFHKGSVKKLYVGKEKKLLNSFLIIGQDVQRRGK